MGGVSSNDTAQYFFDCYEQKVSLPTEKTWLLEYGDFAYFVRC